MPNPLTEVEAGFFNLWRPGTSLPSKAELHAPILGNTHIKPDRNGVFVREAKICTEGLNGRPRPLAWVTQLDSYTEVEVLVEGSG